MSNKVYTVVELFSGIVTNVSAYTNEEDAQKDFERITGVSFADYQTRIDNGEDDDSIVGEDYAGSGIWETEIE